MDIGIGIPNTVLGATGAGLLEWARRADAAGFSSLGTIGALSYPGYEELTALAAAAAVTERIRLLPDVLIAPPRNTAELAKQAATVNEISGGRLTVGLGIGWRAADFVLAGRDFHERGRIFDEQLRQLRAAWDGEALAEDTRPVVPEAARERPLPLLIGGTVDASFRRAAEYGEGWTAGGLPPDAVAASRERAEAAWREAGRDGKPRIVALAYFSLGDTEDVSRRNLLHYYEPAGNEMADMVAGSALRSPEAIKGAIKAYEEAGTDELILDPSVPDTDQVDLLAEVVFGSDS